MCSTDNGARAQLQWCSSNGHEHPCWQHRVQQVPGWRVVSGNAAIQQEWTVKDAESASILVDSIKALAAEQGHAPGSVEVVGTATVIAQLTSAAAGECLHVAREGRCTTTCQPQKLFLSKSAADQHPCIPLPKCNRCHNLCRWSHRGGLHHCCQGQQPGHQPPARTEEGALLGVRQGCLTGTSEELAAHAARLRAGRRWRRWRDRCPLLVER